MAFSLFNKKEEPAKPAAKPAAKAETSAPAQNKAVPTKANVSDKIDAIEAEMMSLDFTAPSALPQVTPKNVLRDAARAAAAPAAQGAPTAPVAKAGTPAAPAQPAKAVAPAATPAAAPGKLQVQHGFNPGAKPAPAGAPNAKSASGGLSLEPHAPAAAKPGVTPPKPAVPPAAKPVAPVPPKGAAPPPTKPAAPSKPAAAPPKPAPGALPRGVLPQGGVASVMMMEVQESPFESAPVLEEAAILYANRQDEAAVAALEDAIKSVGMPKVAQKQAWMLLFDLYENLGMRDRFESATIDFAVSFETSPPAFNDRSAIKDPALQTGGGQYFSLTGALDGKSFKQFDQLKKLSEKNKVVRIEFGKIESVEGEGCELLTKALAGFRKSGLDLVFSGTEHLIKLLNGAIEVGRNEDPEVFWLLLLDLYQFQNMQTAYEETALNYCITYEVSPPSWVEPKKTASATAPKEPATLDVPQDAFYLRGDIEGGNDTLFAELGAYASDKARAVVDVYDVKRMDFLAAGTFLNLVAALASSGKHIELRNPSPLIAALLMTMGFTEHVSLSRR